MAPHPSLSRNLWQQIDSDDTQGPTTTTPRLAHSLLERRSVLSLAASELYIFCGSQSQDIPVWDRKSLRFKDSLRGHTGSVLALEYAEEEKWLFSASGDSTIRVWCTASLTPLYVISPYLETGAGDLFSLTWVPSSRTLYVGCQNTSIQWFDCNKDLQVPSPQGESGTSTPRRREVHKFFDSYPQYERRPADIYANNGPGAQPQSRDISPHSERGGKSPRAFLNISEGNVMDFAHFGYIYCMALLQEEGGSSQVRLATGSGDEFVKIWNCSDGTPTEVHAFECTNSGAIFSLVVKDDSTLFAGCQDGSVKVLDLGTKTLVRSLIVQEGVDVLSLSITGSDLYACSADGNVQRFSASFDCTAAWKAHNGIVLSSIITTDKTHATLITGGNDDHIKMWELSTSSEDPIASPSFGSSQIPDTLTYALSKFISIPSVSSNPSHREDCRQAAIWLKKCLAQLGATAQLLPTENGKNPLVLGTFTGVTPRNKTDKPRVLFYGHYDVIPAPSEGWDSDPFHLNGRNGYLYGRGCTDNKGPILAVAFAVAELLAARKLGLDVVFLIEGEEECGSAGFDEAVQKHKDIIGHIDAILVSNSTWFGEDTPCITYGLRGVVHCSLEISNDRPDLHSGIEGGAVVEPLLDMVHLLATLTDPEHRVKIPSFYAQVRKQDAAEKERIAQIAEGSTTTSILSSRWCEPSLTVHSIDISGPRNATVIPGTIKSQVSIRIVPDQDLCTISQSLSHYLETSFKALNSPNKLKLAVKHTADWWLGELEGFWFDALENAVAAEWGIKPLRIREGGSIPSVPFLEKEFGCHALHLPMGQSSDQAHLPNERISLDNLRKGKAVVERFFKTVVGG
ncbi:Beta-Ala-His dipeptidase [Mycena indigotica]|uniref:Beta-Ala-His dipeptidase n=1 Tax=Mycena indigotica TaxID=2126181 RepID=A0A8H6W2G0_9AGAR|nr:Beta-Ala-His dipeptidase [Mycena indigotica]KAF7299223.1 Beta-Ala-His dipeptidase [Mycena indigotica]